MRFFCLVDFPDGCPAGSRRLQIVHSSDNESSFIDPNTLEEKVTGYATVASALEAVAASEGIPSIHVTAGDHTIPGPFYQAAAEIPSLGQPGLADIAIFNAMGLDGNGIGNHEFDGGSSEFAYMLFSAAYPFISVNLDFTASMLSDATAPPIRIGPDAAECSSVMGHVVKSCFVETSIGRVGLIGRSPADFFNVIEDPSTNLPGIDFVGGRDPETNQPLESAVPMVLAQVDLLEAAGANVIVLLDHAQDFTGDPLSANLLRGIDVIVSAGSTGFISQPTNFGPYNFLREGDMSDELYPIIRTDSNGDYLLVVNTDQLYTYVGNLIVSFDDNGKLLSWDGRSGPIATTQEAIDLFPEMAVPNAAVDAILEQIRATPTIQDGFAVIGQTATLLNGRRAAVRRRETNLGRLVADSTLYGANKYATENGLPKIEIGFKNGGGIRGTYGLTMRSFLSSLLTLLFTCFLHLDSITGPNIISLSVDTALAFDNKLTLLEVTGANLLAAAENSVSRAPAADGRFPQLAGMYIEWDESMPGIEGESEVTTPSRIKTLLIADSDEGCVEEFVTNYQVVGDLTETFTVGTNSFLTSGGDGYNSFAAATILGETTDGEQDILKEYIVCELGGVVNIPDNVRSTRRIQPV